MRGGESGGEDTHVKTGTWELSVMEGESRGTVDISKQVRCAFMIKSLRSSF
jgi:hypothetical protein